METDNRYRTYQGEFGLYGVADNFGILYEAEFTRFEARWLAKFHNEHPDATWEDARKEPYWHDVEDYITTETNDGR